MHNRGIFFHSFKETPGIKTEAVNENLKNHKPVTERKKNSKTETEFAGAILRHILSD